MGIKVAFVTGPEENMGIKYLSAVLKEKNHRTELFFNPQLFNDEVISIKFLGKIFDLRNELINEIAHYKPDLIGFSVHSDFCVWAYDLAFRIKERINVPIIFGGIHPTSVPEEVIQLDPVDMVCVGEGEFALLELADSIERNSLRYDIKNVWFKRKGEIIRNSLRPLADVNELPHPDYDIYYKKNKYFRIGYHTIASRGCPYRCAYCCHSILKGLYPDRGYYRVRSASNLVNELREALRKYNFKIVRFYDDVFPYNMRWLEEFTDLYASHIGLPFICYFHPTTVNQKRVFLLKKAGCSEIRIGVQSLNPKIRREILNRYESNKTIEIALNIIKKNKIKLVTENMLGLPMQNGNDIIEMFGFYNKIRPTRNHFFWLRYYPGLEIGRYRESDLDENKDSVANKNHKVFTHGGDTYGKVNRKLVVALYALPLLPRQFADVFIKKHLWRCLPSSFALWFLNVFSNITSKSCSDRIRRARVFRRYIFFIRRFLSNGN